MTDDELRHIAHQALVLTAGPYLRHQAGGRFALSEGVALTRSDMPGPSFNFAGVVGPSPPLDGVLAVARPFFERWEGGYGILVEGGAGHPVEAEIQARGWSIVEDEPALVWPAIDLTPPPLAKGVEIRLVADAVGLREYTRVTAAGFESPLEMVEQWAPSIAFALDPDLALLVGYCGGTPAAASMLSRTGRAAVIAGVTTIPAFRGRGLGTAMTWAAAREGAARGCTTAVLRSGPMSLSLYRRMGFVQVCHHRTYAVPDELTF